MNIDLKNNLGVDPSIDPAAFTSTVNGVGVDISSKHGAMVVFQAGTITDGTHTPSVEHSNDNGVGDAWATVPAGELIGSLAVLAEDTVQRVGYKGMKGWLRAVSTVSGGPSTGGVYGASVIGSNARRAPLA
jgi:hypothetical protein